MSRLILVILVIVGFCFQSFAMEKESPLFALPLKYWCDVPTTYPSLLTHFFETKMVNYLPYLPQWHDDFVSTQVKNKIWLEINPYDGTPIDFDCEVSVTFSIKHYSFPDGNEKTESHTLKVNYSKTAHTDFKKIDLLELTGGQRVIVTITGFQVSSLTQVQRIEIGKKVILKAQTTDTRYYKKSVFTPINCNTIGFSNSNYPEVTMTWDPLPFAEEYDVEIVYDDAYSPQSNSYSNNPLQPFGGTSPIDEKDFYNNATRITTKKNTFTLPLINEKAQYRVRIRPVGRQGKNWEHRYEHKWSCDDYIHYTNQPHEDDQLNYQTIATYAEEAKYKIVNEYFDGRMASRQKVTALQSKMRGHQYALVQESIYDGIGRKAIEVLPGPKMDGRLEFYEGFSVNNTGNPYSHLDFDTVQTCPPTPGPMGTQSGASQYFSSNFYNSLSPADQSSELALIPDAFKYPFSQTKFMNDNTNRPLAQGGVGKDHHLGTGHETLISYVDPTQSELDRLFGTEVGLAKYYKKIVTEDPNGQVSFAYQDLKGNTIATSLYGKVANLDSLETYKPISMTDDLIGSVKVDSANYQLYTQHVFHVPENNKSYDFDYQMVAAQFRDITCTASTICYDCVYDVEILIINTDCNDTIFIDTMLIGNYQNLNQICEGFSWTSALANVIIQNKGNYVAKAVLTVNEDVADQYVTNYFNDTTNQCVQHLSDFEDFYLAQIPDIPCTYDCSLFEEELARIEAQLIKIKNILNGAVAIDDLNRLKQQQRSLEAQRDALIDICDSNLNKCEQAKKQMMQHFMPLGQYASFDQINYTITDVLSIFNSSTELKNENGDSGFYKGAQFVYPFTQLDGSIVNIDPNSVSLQVFITTYWQESWTEQFLPYHPEYCYLQNCNFESADYDDELYAIGTAQDAINGGYIGTAGMQSLPLIFQNDPQFSSTGELYGEYNTMQGIMSNYFIGAPPSLNAPDQSMYELAIYTVCQSLQTQVDQNLPNAIPPPSNCTNVIGVDYQTNPAIADLVWLAYKGYYISIKQSLENQVRNQIAADGGCWNVCIGKDVTDLEAALAGYVAQPCNADYADAFAEKIKVFGFATDLPGLEEIGNLGIWDDLYDNSNVIIDAIGGALAASIGCGLTYPLPVFPIEGSGTGLVNNLPCVQYDCLSELPGFFNQLIPSGGTTEADEFTNEQLINVPSCFGGSPFLQYSWLDVTLPSGYNPKHSYQATIGSAAADPNMCTVLFTFFDIDNTLPSGQNEYYFDRIISFESFELDPSYLDQYGETNHFIGTALATYNGDTKLVGVKGYITCAKLGRCCGDGAAEGINACMNIPNVDNPATVDAELWIGESNPYFDPLWIVSPCDTNNIVIPDFPQIICADDTTALCCPDSIIGGIIIVPDCQQERIILSLHNASIQYQQYLAEEKKKIKHAYMTKCLAATQTFLMTHESGEHHFVLSYYDQSGNLTRTVPPNGTYDYTTGVDKTFSSATQLASVASARTAGTTFKPDYTQWDTRYTYNSLNQITTQNLPDHGDPGTANMPNPRNGKTRFIYDKLGRLTYSQNPEQALNMDYSYTEYDELGRIIESGQKQKWGFEFMQFMYFNGMGMENGTSPVGGWRAKEQITHTYYDEGPPALLTNTFPGRSLDNLRSRVAYAEYYDTQADLDNGSELSGSYYSYDPLGNVKALTQRLRDAYKKNIEYEYDLVSGNVNKVIYQRAEDDQFIHRYEYDADNRITQVETSTDGCIWDREAKYFYYPHGPLARVEIGDEEVQGQDYIYTIHGWIKGVNSSGLVPKYDPGMDGLAAAQNSTFAPDEVGYMLNYFSGDYTSISGNQDFTPDVGITSPDLFNGNIRNMTTSIGHFIRENADYGYVSNDYSYDQLNRIKEMRPWDGYNPNSNTWTGNDPRGNQWDSKPYFTNYSYDGNGNISSLQRNGASSQVEMDKLTYDYKSKNNRLNAVTDAVSSTNYPINPSGPNPIYDIDSRPIYNYIYDKIGNLKLDNAEGLKIDWNVQGKVRHILDTNGFPNVSGAPTPANDRHIEMVYDPLGNRIANIIDGKATYYVRDAQGNVMATYQDTGVARIYPVVDDTNTGGSTPLPTSTGPGNGRLINPNRGLGIDVPGALASQYNEMNWQSAFIYGSDRLGEYTANKRVGGPKKTDRPVDIGFVPYNGNAQSSTPPATNPSPNIDMSTIDFNLIGTVTLNPNLQNLLGALSNTDPKQTPFTFHSAKTNFVRGQRQYELTNHLSNVLTTVADRKEVNLSATDIATAEVETANDYYPGGMLMPSRNYSYDANYRYKHQGQESDDDLTGDGNNYFYKYRMSDARLNRFWSVDPLYSKYPNNSQYAYSENRFIDMVEFEGLEAVKKNHRLHNRLFTRNPNRRQFSGTTKFGDFLGISYRGKNRRNLGWPGKPKKPKPLNPDTIDDIPPDNPDEPTRKEIIRLIGRNDQIAASSTNTKSNSLVSAQLSTPPTKHFIAKIDHTASVGTSNANINSAWNKLLRDNTGFSVPTRYDRVTVHIRGFNQMQITNLLIAEGVDVSNLQFHRNPFWRYGKNDSVRRSSPFIINIKFEQLTDPNQLEWIR